MSTLGGMRNQVGRFTGSTGSMKHAMRNMKKSELPTDLGLLPGTLVRPRAADKPAFFSRETWRDRLRIELAIIAGPLKNILTQYTQRDEPDPITGKKGAIRLRLSERYYVARELHRRLYTAIAQGDRAELTRIACTGTQRQAIMTIEDRKARNKPAEEWSIKYRGYTPRGNMNEGLFAWFKQMILPPMFKSTRIISDQIVPVMEGIKIRQAVVQIRGRQRLDKKDGSPIKEMDTNECVVIQKFIKGGEEDDWMIWGTMESSGKKAIDEVLEQSSSAKTNRGEFWNKVQEQSMKMGGGNM